MKFSQAFKYYKIHRKYTNYFGIPSKIYIFVFDNG